MSQSKLVFLFAVLVALCSTSSVFGFSSPQFKVRQDTSLNIFGGLKGAFANEDMGARKNEGLSNGPNMNDLWQKN